MFGLQATHSMPQPIAGLDGQLSWGAQWRGDHVAEVGLYNTAARERLSTVRNDRVAQDPLSPHVQQLVLFSDRWRGYATLRGDLLRYDVTGREAVFGALNSGRGRDSQLSPQAGAGACAHAGRSFTSPRRGLPQQHARRHDPHRPGLRPARRPYRAGAGTAPSWAGACSPATTSRWPPRCGSCALIRTMYVGDAGRHRAGRASQRRGIEATMRWRANARWRFEADAAVSRARYRGPAPEGEVLHVDNAPERVSPQAPPTPTARSAPRCACATWARGT